MSAHPRPGLTEAEYLEIDRAAEFRSEYYHGYVYAMSGGSWPHVMLIGSFAGELRAALKKRPCAVASSDMRLRVSPHGLYAYPDVMVICGEPKFVDGRKDTVTNPVLIAEVLSPSTEAYDRGFKAAQYRTLESLQEYVLISQSEPRVEVFRRHTQGEWLMSESIGLEASCRFESVDCRIPLAEIYEKVTFEPEEAPPRVAAEL